MPPISGNALQVGSLLRGGEYVIESCLGQGGFGITYRAEDKALRRTVAIKEFFPSACARAANRLTPAGGWTQGSLDAFKSKFMEEGQMLARLRNAGIPHVYVVFEENGTAYLVMEYVEGRTLDTDLASRGGRLPVNEAISIICKAGEALQVVHAASLIHRDIKPSNIILRSDGHVVLIDFGAAREFVPDSVDSQSQTVILTPGYAPLEQYSRQGKRGPFTDIYALAATLYYLLTGRRPVEALDRANGEPLPAPADLRPEIPKQISDGVMSGLRLRADERPQSAGEFCKLIALGTDAPGDAQATPAVVSAAPTKRPETVSPEPQTTPVGSPQPGTIASPIGHRKARPRSLKVVAAIVLGLVAMGTFGKYEHTKWLTVKMNELVRQADSAYSGGNYSAAASIFKSAMDYDPDPYDWILFDHAAGPIGTDYRITGNYSGAIDMFQHALKSNPSPAQTQNINANLAYSNIKQAQKFNKLRSFANAKKYAEMALRYDPENWRAQYDLRDALKGIGDASEEEALNTKMNASMQTYVTRKATAASLISDGDGLYANGHFGDARVKWNAAVLAAPGTGESDMANERLNKHQTP